MTEEIKQRIAMISRGEVTEGYKKVKFGVVPNEWEVKHFKDKFVRVSRKNREGNNNVLTISAQQGLINQEEFFNKIIASEDKSNYYLLEKGEYAYNKSYSNGYPYGAIKQLERYDKGVVSPLYICFAPTKDNQYTKFYSQYFEAGLMDREIQAFAQEGARNHGLLNISVGDFFNAYLLSPPLSEQQKISKILITCDRVIELKEKLIAEKKQQKKWLMQNLLTGKKRLDGFIGKWEKVKLSKVLLETNLKNNCNLRICSVAVRKGVVDQIEHLGRSYAASDTSNYSKVSYGDIIYTKSPTGEFPYGIVKQSHLKEDVAVSPLYGVFKPISFGLGYMLHCYFSYKENTNNYLYPIIQKGAKNTMNITNSTFVSNYTYLPMDVAEQTAIANILSTADREIELLQSDLAQWKQKKKALMQLLLTGIVRV